MDKSAYYLYLASRQWNILKNQVRERSQGKCERCSIGEHSHTHHLTYERVGKEKLEDLQGLCSDCHEFLSAKSDFDPKAAANILWEITDSLPGEIITGIRKKALKGLITLDLWHKGYTVYISVLRSEEIVKLRKSAR